MLKKKLFVNVSHLVEKKKTQQHLAAMNNMSNLPSNQCTVICLKGDLPGRHKVITALLSLLCFN